MRLFKRGRTWYATFYEDGQRVQRSTKCTDKKAAETIARQWERDGADPDAAVRRTATLTDALKLLIDDRQEQATAGRRSQQTVEFYRRRWVTSRACSNTTTRSDTPRSCSQR